MLLETVLPETVHLTCECGRSSQIPLWPLCQPATTLASTTPRPTVQSQGLSVCPLSQCSCQHFTDGSSETPLEPSLSRALTPMMTSTPLWAWASSIELTPQTWSSSFSGVRCVSCRPSLRSRCLQYNRESLAPTSHALQLPRALWCWKHEHRVHDGCCAWRRNPHCDCAEGPPRWHLCPPWLWLRGPWVRWPWSCF